MDYIIKNGWIVNGKNEKPFYGDLAVKNGKIEEVGEHIEVPSDFSGKCVLDAAGGYVTPGFIDIHRHGDWQAFGNGDDELLNRQGLTTVVNGNCGLSVAPVGEKLREEIAGFLSSVTGEVRQGQADVMSTMSSYLAALSKEKRSVNTGMLAGNGTIRAGVKGYAPGKLSDEEMHQVWNALEESLAAGALGVSLGVAYAPEFEYDRDGLAQALQPLKGTGIPITTHVRNEGDGILLALQEVISVAEELQIPLHVSHLKCIGQKNWGDTPVKILQLFDQAAERGVKVDFDLWKGESDAQPYIPDMVQKMKDDGFAYISDGALVVDVKEETDTKEIPPCMILKSDGASLYNTTDLATMVWRMKDYHPDEIIYVVDKRQELYFTQVFRCARKTGIVKPETELKFLGFGTMNGKDGRPFKTRDGGVMRLEHLISGINEEMLAKIQENQKTKENLGISTEEAENTAKMVALAAIKYGDLSNQASKDYIFDIDRFTSFEGNTGPYILYTIVRIKSILNKYHGLGKDESGEVIGAAHSKSEKDLMLELSKFNAVMESAFEETAPHKICSYIYDLANAFNSFYHGTKIMSEENETVQKSYIRLLELTKSVLETCIDVLGFSAPERM